MAPANPIKNFLNIKISINIRAPAFTGLRSMAVLHIPHLGDVKPAMGRLRGEGALQPIPR
jgi:hypothetical protein